MVEAGAVVAVDRSVVVVVVVVGEVNTEALSVGVSVSVVESVESVVVVVDGVVVDVVVVDVVVVVFVAQELEVRGGNGGGLAGSPPALSDICITA